tara:strand:+ start:260 stop:904 length:645 start_codon:yes stop_codon:yes gene_type:complete
VSLRSEEINRKLLHGLAVAMPAGIFYGPDLLQVSQGMASVVIGGLFGLALLIEILRFRSTLIGALFRKWFGSMLRVNESRSLTGATYVMGGSFLCSLIALQGGLAPAAAFLALTLFILGDAVAALVGKGIGRIRIGGKTLEGALGCFTLCALLACLVFPRLQDFPDAWTMPALLLISALVAILELFPIRLGRWCLNDNLYVPVCVTFITLALQS